MIQAKTNIYFQDNSGAKLVKIFRLKKEKSFEQLCVVKGSVRKTEGEQINTKVSKSSRKVQAHSKVNVFILGTRKEIQRKNGVLVKFPEVRGVIINDETKFVKMIPTSIIGVYPKELKKKFRYKHLLSKKIAHKFHAI